MNASRGACPAVSENLNLRHGTAPPAAALEDGEESHRIPPGYKIGLRDVAVRNPQSSAIFVQSCSFFNRKRSCDLFHLSNHQQNLGAAARPTPSL